MKILLGGVPFGCDNVGDEAILACVVRMLRESVPGAELSVATADPATGPRLGVRAVPAFGFAGTPVAGFAAEAAKHDAYVWCGATGLSDYPHVALRLLELAQQEGVPTFVWGVGMDDELNPVFFKVHGKRRLLLSCLGLVGWYERRLREKLRRRVAAILPRCRGAWLRDPESAAMLATMGFAGAKVAADSAILLGNGKDFTQRHRGTESLTLGLCISTQRQVADLAGLKGLLSDVRSAGWKVVGIPMNPKTDRALLGKLGVECIPGSTPEAVMAAAAECDVVLSSRLHLLILAANAGTPGLGIARGSKLANWLANFGRSVEGSVYDCKWDKVAEHVLAAPNDRGGWEAVRAKAYAALHGRLEAARRELVLGLEGCNGK